MKCLVLITLLVWAGLGTLSAQTTTNAPPEHTPLVAHPPNIVPPSTNTAPSASAPAPTNAPSASLPQTQIKINSDSWVFDLTTHQVIYSGHVRVDAPEMRLRGGQIVADVPQSGGRPTNIVAQTNVVIDFIGPNGQPMHATCDKAVYSDVQGSATNYTVTLTGHARVETAQQIMKGEPIVWNRATRKLTAINEQTIYRQNVLGAPTRSSPTNPPGAHTNQLANPEKNDE